MHSNASHQTRSEMMSRIRSKDTVPEMLVRRGLHSLGFRFRLHRNDLPGRPDLALPRYRAIIFIHGCFWHAHTGCKNFRIPVTRPEFWTKKLMDNRRRDQTNQQKLKEAGWRVLIVWECATRLYSVSTLSDKVAKWLKGTECKDEISALLNET